MRLSYICEADGIWTMAKRSTKNSTSGRLGKLVDNSPTSGSASAEPSFLLKNGAHPQPVLTADKGENLMAGVSSVLVVFVLIEMP